MYSRRNSQAVPMPSREVQQHEVQEEDLEDCEAVWARREAARTRQIMIGKARPEYRRYLAEVPVDQRGPAHPMTPNPRDRVSKRQFDRSLGDWRRKLHEFDAEMGFVSDSPLELRSTSSSDGPVQPGAMPLSLPACNGSTLQPPTRPPSFPAPTRGESQAPSTSSPASMSPRMSPPPQAPPAQQALVPQHPPPLQPPVVHEFCPGIVQLRLADQLPAPAPAPAHQAHQAHQAPEFVPQAAQQAQEFPPVDYASAAAIGIAVAMATLMGSGQMPPQGQAQMPWAPQPDAYDPNMYVCHPMETMVPAMPPPPPVPTMALAPETVTPMRLRPISFEDRETPPPLPFEMQASVDGFHQFQVGQLGVVSEECEKVRLTYEDVMSPRNTKSDSTLLAIPKEDAAPPFTPQRRKAPGSPPSSVVRTPCPGPWVMETPSPQNCSSLGPYAFGDAFGPFAFPG